MQPGLAKTQFSESFHRSPWNFAKKSPSFSIKTWPQFEIQLIRKRISYFDGLLTQRLLKNYPEISQEAAFFICHLVKSAQEGHLCILADQDVVPSVASLWNDENGEPLSGEDEKTIGQFILNGSKLIPESIITHIQNPFDQGCPATPLCEYKNHYYLQRHWVLESRFLYDMAKHIQALPGLQFDQPGLQNELKSMQDGGKINAEQAQAIGTACNHPLSLITGGPGTGKTYTAGKLIELYWNNLSPDRQSDCQIVLAAPTGKAAANLQKSLTKATAHLKHFPDLQAKTLHALLNLNQTASKKTRLSADFIVIDESSMIDITVMSALFASLKPGSRLVLLGDPHQLPSVEAGSIFKDLTQIEGIPCTELKICLRTELKSIIDLADLVKNGQSAQAISQINQARAGISWLPIPTDSKKAQKELISYAVDFFPYYVESDQDALSLLDAFNAVRLLSPMRQGPFGVDVINQLIWQQLCKKLPDHGWMAIPIMVISNDYRQDLFNGETGLLMRKLPLNKIYIEDYALFPGRFADGECKRLPAMMLPKYELAYCLSVHKSQGSEFDRVLLVMPEGAELFGREIFYTALTRARRQIEIYGSENTLTKTILTKQTRLSGITTRFPSRNEDLALK